MAFKRVVIIVLDSLGVGALPDAALFGDEGAHTLDNISRVCGEPLDIPNLASLGLGLVEGVESVEHVERPRGYYGRMAELTKAKDTISGHLEMAGIVMDPPFVTYPEGLPQEILRLFIEKTGYGYLFGGPASGTEIIERLGVEHMESGKPILYTSADSVFQIAAHVDIIPTDKLYEICRKSRAFLDDYRVGRVIARPFAGEPGAFVRTFARKDFSLDTKSKSVLETISQSGVSVTGIGKIGDIYSHRGISHEIHTKSNEDGMASTLKVVAEQDTGLIFTNLVDFDMLYGHRNDALGYAGALCAFDRWLPPLMELLGEEDLLIITADHGCDPTRAGTDHTREYVPLLVFFNGPSECGPLGTRTTFADIGATLADIFGQKPLQGATSFLSLLA